MRKRILAGALAMMLPQMVQAQTVSFKDPVGDDNGPGSYVYPTDAAYTPGSFDMTGFEARQLGTNLEFTVRMSAPLIDHWKMGGGFSTQMIFVFIRTGAGKYLDGLPGLNIRFARPGWDKVVILSPQRPARVLTEVKVKAAPFLADVLIPQRTRGVGSAIIGSVPLAGLGGGNPAAWSYQVVVAGNEGFPSGTDLMTRKVDEYARQHRFGGGTDHDCDPHVMDVLAGTGAGMPGEVAAQAKALAYKCGADGRTVAAATLPMLRK